MTINNSEKLEHPGMYNEGVQPIGYNPQITKDYLQQEQVGLTKAVDDGRPSLNVQEYAPGTILSDEYFNHSTRGVQQLSSYSVNTVEQDEARLQEVEKQRQKGYSTYNSPPLNSGAPFLSEEVKPTQQQLEKQIKQSQINSLTNKINSLQVEKGNLEIRLVGVEIALVKARGQLQQLESE